MDDWCAVVAFIMQETFRREARGEEASWATTRVMLQRYARLLGMDAYEEWSKRYRPFHIPGWDMS